MDPSRSRALSSFVPLYRFQVCCVFSYIANLFLYRYSHIKVYNMYFENENNYWFCVEAKFT